MFTRKYTRDGKTAKQSPVSSGYATILLGRAVLNGYDIKRVDGKKYIITGSKVTWEYESKGFDWAEEKRLEEAEHEQKLW